jgi:hypothetical protein
MLEGKKEIHSSLPSSCRLSLLHSSRCRGLISRWNVTPYVNLHKLVMKPAGTSLSLRTTRRLPHMWSSDICMCLLSVLLDGINNFITSDCIYHFCEGHDATQHAAFGEACHIAVTLRMHEESSYEGLDLIECEIRRRAFWLLFGGAPTSTATDFLIRTILFDSADKSESILLGRPICLRDEDCTGMSLFPTDGRLCLMTSVPQ